MNEKQYLHDLIASDRRYPTVNAYGPLFGSPEYSSDMLPILDPVKNIATTFTAPVRDASMPLNLGPGHAAALDALQPSPYWGSERIWETRVNNHNSMFGRDGRRVAGRLGARRREPGVLQGGLGSPVGQGVPDGARRPAHRGARSEDEEIHLRRDLLLDASPAVRLRRERHAVDERRRSGRRLAEHEDVRRDRRRREVAGLDGARARHQRQRQARRLRRSRSAGRSGEGHAHQLAVLCGDAEPGRRIDLGRDARRARRGRPACAWIESAGDRAGRDLQRAAARLRRARRRHRQQGRGLGVARQRPHGQLRSPQVQRRRSTGRRPPATIAPKAGRSISIPARASEASARTAPSRATTRGSTSTTRSGWATTCRCQPAT